MDLSIHLVSQVLPQVPYRQWTITFPRSIRFLLARDKKLLSKIFGCVIRSIFSWQKMQVKNEGFEEVYPGAVGLLQNFGGALNVNFHAHNVLIDGVFVGNKEEELCFIELEPTTKDIHTILQKIIGKVERVLCKYQEEHDSDEHTAYEQLLAESVQASQIAGARDPDQQSDEEAESLTTSSRTKPRSACIECFSLHANTNVRDKDRKGLERLIRYGTRHAYSQQQLTLLENGDVCFRLKKSWGPHGITELVMTPVKFLLRITALIPKPYLNMIRYYGIFSPHSNRQHEVCPTQVNIGHHFAKAGKTPKPTPENNQQKKGTDRTYLLNPTSIRRPQPQHSSTQGPCAATAVEQERQKYECTEYPVRVGSRIPWAELVRFSFLEDLKVCPKCGSAMLIIAVIGAVQTDVMHENHGPSAFANRLFRATRSSSSSTVRIRI